MLAARLGDHTSSPSGDDAIRQDLQMIKALLQSRPVDSNPSELMVSLGAMVANLCEAKGVSYFYPRHLSEEFYRWGWVGPNGLDQRMALVQRQQLDNATVGSQMDARSTQRP